MITHSSRGDALLLESKLEMFVVVVKHLFFDTTVLQRRCGNV